MNKKRVPKKVKLVAEANLIRKKHFVEFIQEHVGLKNMNYLDAIVYYCEKNNIDPGTVGPLIPKDIKLKLKSEAQQLNLVKGKNTGLFE